ncbi:GFA family protein [Variovorax ureilyticus]|uniref:GFA family protein n=1 Tax=Variovorax ureilyticus TaxID=1836198 RepID=A0ABU8VNU8_9BURK
MFAADAVEFTGEPKEHSRISDAGNVVRRRFCGRCGSHLFADTSAYPGSIIVRVGTMDDPSSITPRANIWSARAPRWACIDPALERFEVQPAAGTKPG